MKLFVLIFVLLFIFGCNRNKSAENKNTDHSSDSISYLMPKKSQFKYFNKLFFKNYFYNEIGDTSKILNPNPNKLTIEQRKKWNYLIADGVMLSDTFMTRAKFDSYQNKVGDILPIIITVNGDDYSEYKLICLNKKAEMTSIIGIAGGLGGGPDSSNSKGKYSNVYFSRKFSEFINDSILKTYFIKITNRENTITKNNDIQFIFDSIVTIHKILRDGKITLLKRDSVRIRNPY